MFQILTDTQPACRRGRGKIAERQPDHSESITPHCRTRRKPHGLLHEIENIVLCPLNRHCH